MSERKYSFEPVLDATTRVLVLGSLPGEISLRRAQYYAHPQNQFWRLLEPVIGTRLAELAYPQRLAALRSAGLGLWDVIRSAQRPGSLDGAIRDSEPNALVGVISAHPGLRAIAFNGAKASELGRRQLDAVGVLLPSLELLSLPSSSPAYTMAFDSKQREWNRIRRFLDLGATDATGASSGACVD